MGLDISHNCWHGAYSSFMRFRQAIAKAVGIPLSVMEGFYHPPVWAFEQLTPGARTAINEVLESLPLSWDLFKGEPLLALLHHSDCEGEIPSEQCAALAKRLREIAPLLRGQDGCGHLGNIEAKVIQFASGCELAASRGENVEFH